MCPEDWEWSSYRATAGIIKATDFLTTEWVLGQFSQNKAEAKRRYVQFVREGIKSKTESPWQQLKGRIFFGSSQFILEMQEKLWVHYTTVSRVIGNLQGEM